MKKTTIFTFWLLFALPLCAQERQQLSFMFEFETDTLGILDPWYFFVKVKNESGQSVRFHPTPIWNFNAAVTADIKVEIYSEAIDKWQNTQIVKSHCEILENRLDSFSVDKTFSWEFRCISPYKYLHYGENVIRILYCEKCNSDGYINSVCYYSEPYTIYIKPYQKKDLEAYNYLNGLPNPAVLFFPVIQTDCDTSYITNGVYLVEHFPESTFAAYAKLNLCACYLSKANRIMYAEGKDIVKYLEFLRLSKRYGDELSDSKDNRISEKLKVLFSELQNSLATFYFLRNEDVPESIQKEFNF